MANKTMKTLTMNGVTYEIVDETSRKNITNKVDKVDGKGLSTNDYTTTEKNKLAGIASGANKTVVDSALSSTSTNPVQNKVVNTAISNLNTLVGDTAVSTQINNAINNITTATTSKSGLMSSTDKTKLNATNIAYGTCSTAAVTAAKVITISGNTNWALTAGSMIVVKFSATNSAQNPTFNVNNTGAKKVWYNTALITTSNLDYAGTANRPMNFMYDGTQYVFVGWSLDNNTTYSNASLGQGYATCSTAAATVAKTASLSSYALTTGGIVAVKFTYDVPANATLNVNSKGAKAIYYKGAAITDGVIKAGDTATFIYSTQYHLISIDSGGSALTSDPREGDSENPELSAVPVNADSLGGILASEYATKEWVSEILDNIRFASEVNW